jgi:hypothetical protein
VGRPESGHVTFVNARPISNWNHVVSVPATWHFPDALRPTILISEMQDSAVKLLRALRRPGTDSAAVTRQRAWTGLERAAIAVVIAAGFLAAPGPTFACVSDHPTFSEAVGGASAIARVTIVEGFDAVSGDPTHSETYRVERVLKGSLPELVTIAPAWTSLCQDSVGYFAGAEASEGRTILIALNLSFGDQVIHPMWAELDGVGLFGTAGIPDGVTTLAALERAILRQVALPETSTADSKTVSLLPWALVAGLALLGASVVFRRRPSVG